MIMELLILVLAAAAAAFGQGPGEGPRGGMRGDPLFIALDLDGDGSISAAELAKAAPALRKLDKNGDGKLSEDELRPTFAGGPGRERRPEGPGETQPPDMVQTMMAFDKNGDGKLEKSELPERMQNLFARADTNQDGFLTKDEIQKLAANQRTPGEGGMNREGGRGPMGGEGGRRGGPGGMARFNPIFAALDADGDGTLSSAEIDNAPVALKKLDKDGDGAISREEARPSFPGIRPLGEDRPRREGVL
jgi:Ca2+-binding EF-hand superfamily protein